MTLLPPAERAANLVILCLGFVLVLFAAGAGSAWVYAIWRWALTDNSCLL